MQTQLDQSLIDLLIFHTLDVTVFTTISTVTLISNNVPEVIAYGLIFVYKVFLLKDGFCLISYAITKYFSIFHQSILNTFSENKITLLQRFLGLLFSIVIQVFDFNSLSKSAYVSCLTGNDLTRSLFNCGYGSFGINLPNRGFELFLRRWNHVSNLDYFGPITKQYNVTAIPAMFIVDTDGKIIAKNLRGQALRNKVAELLAP